MNRDNHSQIIIGIILISIGVLFLLNTFSIIPVIDWSIFLKYWPLILIFLGLNIILRRTWLWWLVPLLLIITILIFFFFQPGIGQIDYYKYNRGLFDFYSPKDRSGVYNYSVDYDRPVDIFDIKLSFPSGELTVSSGSENDLFSAELEYFSRKPIIKYNLNDNNKQASLNISQPGKSNPFNYSRLANKWSLLFNDDMPIKLLINSGAGEFKLRLLDLMVQEVVLNLGAGDLEVELGSKTRYLELNSGAADVDLSLPEGIGVRIKTTGIVNNNNFIEKGLQKEAGFYLTKNYDTTVHKLDIKITSPASDIKLDFY
ncbi:hypothetical protein GM661_16700 [Iocasia frigidifontis]|uniref:DUF5668 domain-containing protein n=1 Tax=Iocasia fonsfrigidae TaxID=2682810 RepID=A0A8A7KI52_9FIRM|nr:toast rack family protein [Iocasia fonsfrigidae]QTL99468.1 hypothetical protein GM661_16700 [Iocasia fonsfrigidae]